MKKAQIAMAAAFVFVIAGISLTSLFMKDREFSENENRYLEAVPKFTWEKFLDGTFQKNLEEYLNDQICFRDQWIVGKTALQMAAGDTDIGGAYIGQDGYDFEKITPDDVDEELYAKNVKAIENYFEKISGMIDPDRLSFMLVPTSGLVMEDYLPDNAILFNQDACINQAQKAMQSYNFIDVRSVLEANSDAGVYYRTDHHWTSYGAYLAYTRWCDRTNHDVWAQSKFEQTEMSTRFRGSLYSKVLNANSAYDSLICYQRKDDSQYLITMDGQQTDSFFDESFLDKKDKYAFFFGGNHAQVGIERLATKDDNAAERNLLVIKDSFANCFVPMIAAEFDHVYMVDLRYYTGNMGQYLVDNEITDVLVLYNISNFVSDRNLFKLNMAVLPTDDANNQDQPQEEPVVEEPVEEKTYPVITTNQTPLIMGNLVVLGDSAFEFYAYKENQAQKYTDGINALSAKLDGKASVSDLLVPLSSGIVYPDSLKDTFDSEAQKYAMEQILVALDESVNGVNIYDSLMQHRDQYLYFRTDHHWTALGAYYAYCAYCETKGLTPAPIDSYETVTYNGFLGSLYNEYPNSVMEANPDSITAYLPKFDYDMKVTDINGNVSNGTLISNGDNISGSSKYCLFVHGDQPYEEIHNKELSNGKACIVVKESYGNAFVPFLIEQYEYVYVVDYRYYSGTIEELVDKTGAQDVLFINNLYAVRNQYLLGKLLGVMGE